MYVVRGGYSESRRFPNMWTGLHVVNLSEKEMCRLIRNLDMVYVRYDMEVSASEIFDRTYTRPKPDPSQKTFKDYVEKLFTKERLTIYWEDARGHMRFSLIFSAKNLYSKLMQEQDWQYKRTDWCDHIPDVLYK